MALAVGKLYKQGAGIYHMRLLAGKSGLHRLVKWVHIVEDEEATLFLHGGELVFTAGIRSRTKENWLLDYAKNLERAGVSAFVVNLGPHISSVPQEVIDFCEETEMPLFTIPWETRMVDMTRSFCEMILHTEEVETTMATCIKNILFQIGDANTHILQMERYGYLRNSTFCFVNVVPEEDTGADVPQLLERYGMYAEGIARNISELFIYFTYQNNLILVLVDYSDHEIRELADQLSRDLPRHCGGKIFLGISPNHLGIMNQIPNFHRALETGRLAKRQKQEVLFYDDLDFSKVLLSVQDKSVLEDYYSKFLGKIERYDFQNGTDYLGFLKVYLENNASPGLVAKKEFIHRNTVNNTLRKIEKITGADLSLLGNKVKCVLGFWIRDLL